MQACLKDGGGYPMAYDEATRWASLRDAIVFLRKNLGP
jgi:hypothetical protein